MTMQLTQQTAMNVWTMNKYDMALYGESPKIKAVLPVWCVHDYKNNIVAHDLMIPFQEHHHTLSVI